MKKIAIALLPALLFALPVHAEDAPAGKDYVILKVGDEKIMKSEVDEVWKTVFPGGNPPALDTFNPKVKENLLRGVASEHVLLKEADKTGVQNEDAVKAKIAAATRQIVIQQFLKEKTKDLVSDAKLHEAYDDYIKKQEAGGNEEIHARHILVKTEAQAKEIEKKLKHGGSFEKLAKEESEDKGSGAAGGDLGWFTADKMVPEFSKAAFALKKGQISAPVKTDFGWHIIQVTDRRKATPPTFDQMKDELRQEAGNKAVAEYVASLMKNEKVVEVDADGHEKVLPPLDDKAAAPDSKPDSQ